MTEKYQRKTEHVGISAIRITEKGLPDREVTCSGCKSPVIIKPLIEYDMKLSLFWAGVCPNCSGLNIRGPRGFENAITKEEEKKIFSWLVKKE